MKSFKPFIAIFLVFVTFTSLFEATEKPKEGEVTTGSLGDEAEKKVVKGEKDLKEKETKKSTDLHVFLESNLRKILEAVKDNDKTELPEETVELIEQTVTYHRSMSSKFGKNLVLSLPLIRIWVDLSVRPSLQTKKTVYGLIFHYFEGEAKRDRALHLNTVAKLVTLLQRIKKINIAIKKKPAAIKIWSPKIVLAELGAQFNELNEFFPDLKYYYPFLHKSLDGAQSQDDETRKINLNQLETSLELVLNSDLVYFMDRLYHHSDHPKLDVDVVRDWLRAIALIEPDLTIHSKLEEDENPLEKDSININKIYLASNPPKHLRFEAELKQIKEVKQLCERLSLRVLLIQKLIEDQDGAFLPDKQIYPVKEAVNEVLVDFEGTQKDAKTTDMLLRQAEVAFLENLKKLASRWDMTYSEYIKELKGYIQLYLKDQKERALANTPIFILRVCTVFLRIKSLVLTTELTDSGITKNTVTTTLGQTYTDLLKSPFDEDPIFKDCGLGEPSKLAHQDSTVKIIAVLKVVGKNIEAALRAILEKYKLDLKTFRETGSQSIAPIQDLLQCLKIILQQFGKPKIPFSNVNKLLMPEAPLRSNDIPGIVSSIIDSLDPKTIISSSFENSQ